MKEYKIGNSRIYVYSSLLDMSEEDRDTWIQKEIEKGNPDLLRIAEIVDECYRNFKK